MRLRNPLVSVVIRSTARPTLQRALASVGAQDYARIEIIVIAASGPTHPTPLATAGAHPVHFVRSNQRLDRVEAANAGLDSAHGDWITFLDDDDELLPGHTTTLVNASRSDETCQVVHSFAVATGTNGETHNVGQPSSLVELYDRNYIQMSSALWSRELVDRGCRFDPSFVTHQDWDFFIQCAQHSAFIFVPRRCSIWNWEIGGSNAGGGVNQSVQVFGAAHAKIQRKWARERAMMEGLSSSTLSSASRSVMAGDLDEARRTLHLLLQTVQNHPEALNLLANIELRMGHLEDAERFQTTAVQTRPRDPRLIFNLATIHRANGRLESSRRLEEVALRLNPDLVPGNGSSW